MPVTNSTQTYRAPGATLRAKHMPDVSPFWFAEVEDRKAWTDSIFLAAALRKGAEGRKVYRLWTLGKALQQWLNVNGHHGNGPLPLDWTRGLFRQYLGKHHRQVWAMAERWGVIKTWRRKNAVVFCAHDRLPHDIFFSVLGFTVDDAMERGSAANLLWVSHCEIRQSFRLQFDLDWSYKDENAHLTTLFMEALNAFGFEWSLEVFGRVLDRHPDTLTEHGRTVNETVVKRCILVPHVPSVPNWKNADRPLELQNGLPMPKPGKKADKLLRRLNATRAGKKDSSTRYFLFHDATDDSLHLARRVPNLHTRRLKNERPEVRYSYRNLTWGRLSKLDSVRDVRARAHRNGFNEHNENRKVQAYHERRVTVQKTELLNAGIEGLDRSLALACLNDSQLVTKLEGGQSEIIYALGDENGRVTFPTSGVASGPTQAGNIGSAGGTCRRNRRIKVAASLRWTNPPRRRPMKQGRRKYHLTMNLAVSKDAGHRKVPHYKVGGAIQDEWKDLLQVKTSRRRVRVVTTRRSALSREYARKASYCGHCTKRLPSYPHPLYRRTCPSCAGTLSLGTVL